MGEIDKAHDTLGYVVEKTWDAVGKLAVAGPAVDEIRGRIEAVVGQDNKNPQAQEVMNILSQIANRLEEVPEILNAVVQSVRNLDRDI